MGTGSSAILLYFLFLITTDSISTIHGAIVLRGEPSLKLARNPEEYIESEPLDGVNIHENDILISESDKAGKRRALREVNSLRQWPSRRIPYEIDPEAAFVRNETDMLMSAFREFADKTCVQFVPRSNEHDYVFITTDPKRGCLSYIGWQGGRQEMYLLRPNCFFLKGTIIHELMHTIGFYHEHSRPDRDDHVRIMWDNIRSDKTSNFQIEQAGNLLGAPYDYLSVMHYSALTFSKDPDSKLYSMIPKDPSFSAERLGQRRGFSAVDLQQINSFYNCPASNPFVASLDHFVPPPSTTPWLPSPSVFHNGGPFPQFIRQSRSQSPWFSWLNQDGIESSVDFEEVPTSTSTGSPSDAAPVQLIPGASEFTVITSSAEPVCAGNFFPDAVLSFLGFFYLFKAGQYWKFTYHTDGLFVREPNFPKAYSANFNIDMPDQLDSVFSYLTYIYFVKGSKVWVARSDTDIRGPVALSLLFPGLPDSAWDTIFTRDTTINFVSGASTWLYDVNADKVTGPDNAAQPPLFTKGPMAQMSDGRMAAFPREEFFGSDQSYVYMLNRTTGQVLPGYPRPLAETFC
ncbi:hypothetical protein RvY_00891 [Ramazzottius varieornatus]|uniref:Metalloendopeptidase n=1 Tax=Ramazzottius varieornatus TaxID=947166 RepID=A0A1D1UKH1_RAMVA|nr:hypothetical protein RvY_00891 [Ramazzottius varieornatus]